MACYFGARQLTLLWTGSHREVEERMLAQPLLDALEPHMALLLEVRHDRLQ